ncbi:MAG: hypothetical protein AAGA58_12270 [Verrucomicrobiota bacterium]
MPRGKKRIFTLKRVLVGLAALPLLAIIGGNFCLNIGWVKSKLERRIAGMRGGGTVEISRVWWLPFAGVNLEGIRFAREGEDTPHRVGAVTLHPDWTTLHQRNIDIRRVIVDRPEFFFTPGSLLVTNGASPPQVPANQTQAPALTPLSPDAVPPDFDDAPIVVENTTTPPITENQPPPPAPVTPQSPPKNSAEAANPTPPSTPVQTPKKQKQGPRQIVLKNVEIHRGAIRLEHDFKALGEIVVEDLSLSVNLADENPGTGTFRIAAINVGERPVALNIESPVEVKQTAVAMTKITGTLGGGSLRGAALADLARRGMPVRAELGWTGVEATEILPMNALDAPAQLASGSINGRLALRGFLSQLPNSAVQLFTEVVNASVEFDAGFERLNNMLTIDDEGRALIEEFKVQVSGANGQFVVHDAKLSSGRMLGRARGFAQLDSRFLLSSRLYVDRRTNDTVYFETAEGAMPIRFDPLFGTDWIYHDFHVAGTPGAPLADFLQPGAFLPFPDIVRQLGTVTKVDAFTSNVSLAPAN